LAQKGRKNGVLRGTNRNPSRNWHLRVARKQEEKDESAPGYQDKKKKAIPRGENKGKRAMKSKDLTN